MKKNIVKLNIRPIWQIGKGHNSHLGGSGHHDNRPKRARTRQAINKRALDEY